MRLFVLIDNMWTKVEGWRNGQSLIRMLEVCLVRQNWSMEVEEKVGAVKGHGGPHHQGEAHSNHGEPDKGVMQARDVHALAGLVKCWWWV